MPPNLGSAYEISIKESVEMIARLTGFEGEIVWDTTRAQERFGFEAQTRFEEGLRETIRWYEQVRR